jgi:hypothetical protein
MQKVMYEMNTERAGETDEQTYARAMRDPEVQEIMADPLMRQILQDSQQDPRALVDHMKNPMVCPITIAWSAHIVRWQSYSVAEALMHMSLELTFADCAKDPKVDQRWYYPYTMSWSSGSKQRALIKAKQLPALRSIACMLIGQSDYKAEIPGIYQL